MVVKPMKWFTASASGILCFTAVAKLGSAFGHAGILQQPDPLVGLTFQNLMILASLLELATAALCFCCNSRTIAAAAVAWLATVFVVYRVSLSLIGWHRPCPCLGNFTDALHISPTLADNILKVILAYLFIGSYALLFWPRSLRPIEQSSDIKFKKLPNQNN